MGQRGAGKETRPKFGGGEASNDDLRAYAQQGDLAALRDLLNQLLEPQNIQVHPVPSSRGLNLELGARQFPKARAIAAKIDRFLVGLQPLPWQSVALVAYRLSSPTQKASEMPEWIERFAIGERAKSLDGSRTTNPRQARQKQSEAAKPDANCPQAIARESWQALAIGLALAVGISALGFLRVIFYGFVIMVHEVGHAAAHWLFGQPAIPAVNLLFGGGITLSFGQSKLLLLAIYAGLGYLVYHLRETPRLAVILGVFALVYSISLLGTWDESLPIFMGHGLEAGAIAICLYLGMSGQLCRFAFDQTIYAMLGWFTLLQRVSWAWKLHRDFVTQSIYRDGIGGMIDNDFVKLESQYWGMSLENIALLFLLLCLAAPVVAFLGHRYGSWLKQSWLFLRSPVL